jgi:hypothetical protein
MAVNRKLAEFVDNAAEHNIPPSVITGMLSSQGWTEPQIFEALADHYQRTTGLEVPRRSGSSASAKDAFFYLLLFFTLATWTIALSWLAFCLIDRWLADPLFSQRYPGWSTSEIASSLAALLVGFPLYLLISRAVIRDTRANPDKLESPVRKWLTYLALVVAAAVFTGDLITDLAFLLRGEITSRFLAKSFIVLVLSGGIVFYYFGGLRRTEAEAEVSNLDRVMAGLASALVLLMVVLGFTNLGPPSAQRALRADGMRLQALYQTDMALREYWTEHQHQLPATLAMLPNNRAVDPVTHKPFEYVPGEGSHYKVCVEFERASEPDPNGYDGSIWRHGVGHQCFELDTVVMKPYPAMTNVY